MNPELTITENKNINNNLKKMQENFLNSTLGKTINNAIDIGLRSALPDLIEDEIINVKDAIIENGFDDGIKTAISSAIDLGKSAIGIITGNFENTNQIEMAVKKGGIIDSVSELLDFAVKKANQKGFINDSISNLIINGKDTILDTISDRIESNLETQIKSIEKLQSYCKKWNQHYNEKDFDNMEKAYKNIERYLEKTIPLENIIKEARKIENLHSLIKNNGEKFDITENQKRLAEVLIS